MMSSAYRAITLRAPLSLIAPILLLAACGGTGGSAAGETPSPEEARKGMVSLTPPEDMLPATIGPFRGGSYHFFDNPALGFSRRYDDGSPIYADVYVYPTPYTTVGCRRACAEEVVARETAGFVQYAIPSLQDSAYYDAVTVEQDTTIMVATNRETLPVFQVTLGLVAEGRKLLSYFILVPWYGHTLKVRLTGPAQYVAWPDPMVFMKQLLDGSTPAYRCSLGPSDEDPIVLSTEASGGYSGPRIADAVGRALPELGYRVLMKDASKGIWITEPESAIQVGQGGRRVAVPSGVQVAVMIKTDIVAELHIQAEPLCKLQDDEWRDAMESGKATGPATAALVLVRAIEDQLRR